MPLRVRFAPSPTGSLHIGGARTALYNLLAARQQEGGKLILRIEDTDRKRSTPEATAGLLRDLNWLGIHFDEGPYYQSQRLELYRELAKRLTHVGEAYEAWDSEEELDAQRAKAKARGETYRYQRQLHSIQEIARFEAEGRKPVLRFLSYEGPITLQDEILGEVKFKSGEIDDFVILKADGFPTYHFAVVVDDHFMDVSLVLRGQEHLTNTHKHLVLYKALCWTPPRFGHLPVIKNPTGEGKMGKREKAKAARHAAQKVEQEAGREHTDWTWLAGLTSRPLSEVTSFMAGTTDEVSMASDIAEALDVELPMIEVMDFRRRGYLPEALLNYIALVGWGAEQDRELFTLEELTAAFSIDRVNKASGRFDPQKLDWMNGEYMKTLPTYILLSRMEEWLEVTDSPLAKLNSGRRADLLELCRGRVRTFEDIERVTLVLFHAPMAYNEQQVEQHLNAEGQTRLRTARDALAGLETWTRESLRAALEAQDIRKVAPPVRIAMTGTGRGPQVEVLLHFLGREETLARIDRVLATLAPESYH